MIQDPHLVPVKPDLFAERQCPVCASAALDVIGTVFPGINVFGEYRCQTCGYAFYHDLPVGFAVDHHMAIGKDGKAHIPGEYAHFVQAPTIDGMRSPSNEDVTITRTVYRSSDRVVVLNTLDYLYGHVLLKLWNAQHYLDHHQDLGLILIIPKIFTWLVPKGVAEVWTVDLGLGKTQGWYPSIDRQVQEFLADFKEVHMAKGYAHPDKSEVDIERFCGVASFPLQEFKDRPPHVTFVLRDDRLWHGGPLAKWTGMAMSGIGLRGLRRWIFTGLQDRLVRRTIRKVRKSIPDLQATIVGLGKPGTPMAGVVDLRTRSMNTNVELEWCQAYGRSQLVIGVHGSNMLLPTALAAGCVEVLPFDRFRNLAQDVAVRYRDVMQLFLYRFVNEFASPVLVASHIISVFEHFESFYRNNRVNVYGKKP